MSEMNNTEKEQLLKELAAGYTGNEAEAERIAAEAGGDENPVRRVRELSVMYVQDRDRDLFEDVKTPQEDGKELSEIRDLNHDLLFMDHEERIVSLMKVYEHLSNAEIASILGIDEGYVRALLQEAEQKLPRPEENIPVKEETVPEVKPEEKPKWHFNISLKTGLILAAVLVFALGIFLSVRTYSRGQYERGILAMENGSYEEAVQYFKKAAAWGEGDHALLKTGDAYFQMGNDIDAYTFYEDYHEKYPKEEYVIDQMILCLKEQADRSIMANDLTKAQTALEKINSLKASVFIDYRLKALEAGGHYQTDDGSVWNLYGELVKAACLTENNAVLYTVEIQYDDNGHWTKMNAGKSGTLRTSQYDGFEFADDTCYDIRWIPGGDLPAAYAVSYTGEREDAVYEKDEQGNVLSMTIEHPENSSQPFAAFTKAVFIRSETGEVIGADVYDQNERKIGRGIYVPENGWLYLFHLSR